MSNDATNTQKEIIKTVVDAIMALEIDADEKVRQINAFLATFLR